MYGFQREGCLLMLQAPREFTSERLVNWHAIWRRLNIKVFTSLLQDFQFLERVMIHINQLMEYISQNKINWITANIAVIQAFLYFYSLFYQQSLDMFLSVNTNHRNDMRTLSAISAHPDQTQPDEITWNPESSMESHRQSQHKIDLTQVFRAYQLFSQDDVIVESALMHSEQLSKSFEAEILLKRQDSQKGRTFKIRGAYFQYLVSDQHRRKEGYIIVSDGNFASSYAIIAGLFKTRCVIFLPHTCHQHKLQKIKSQGKQFIEVIQIGKDFEQCTQQALKYSAQHKIPLLRSFETLTLLHGFATIAKEIVEARLKKQVDYVLVPTGGGGLVSAIASVIKQISPNTKVIAVQPDICKPFSTSILNKKMESYERVSKFCNGSSVKTTSQNAYLIGRTSVDAFVEVTQRKLAEKIIKLYSQGIICEPSGALAVAGLQKVRHLIKGKTVVCIMSGANIDLTKLDEARQMAMVSKGIKNHYHFHLPNRKNIMYELITTCFKPTDIISVQYSQRFGKQESQALISIESQSQDDVEDYIIKLNEGKYHFENINQKEDMLDIFF